MTTNDMNEPEYELLWAVLQSEPLVTRLSRAAGGWRDLSEHELEQLDLTCIERQQVQALQELTRRSYPDMARVKLPCSDAVGQVYGRRLGGLQHEVMLAVALDGQNHFLAEVELGRGGAHGMSITPADVLRPLIRIGASAFLILHNHPSGCPQPSQADIQMTRALQACADIVGIPLVDHVIVGGRGGGYASLLDLGLLQEQRGAA